MLLKPGDNLPTALTIRGQYDVAILGASRVTLWARMRLASRQTLRAVRFNIELVSISFL